jgi:hypothetical protein
MNVGDFPFAALLDAEEPEWHEVVDDTPAACTIVEYGQDWRTDSDDARVLIFTAAPLSLELEVMAGHVVGQIVPPGPGEILVETSDGATFRVNADDIGFFDLSDGPRGSVRLRCDTPTGRLITDWICL